MRYLGYFLRKIRTFQNFQKIAQSALIAQDSNCMPSKASGTLGTVPMWSTLLCD